MTLPGRHGSLDGRDEADELLVPMAGHAAADDLAFEHAERREQGRGAVALVVVGEGRALAPLHRQAGLRAVERLDLALLVDGDHHGMARRVHVEADDVVELGGEVGIGRTLEGPDAVRLQPVSGPDALDGAQRKAHRLGHGAAGPMRDRTGRRPQGTLDHGVDLGLRHRRNAGRTRLVAQQAIETLFRVAPLPAPHHGSADADPIGDLQHRQMVRRGKDDLRPLNMLHGAAAILDDIAQPSTISSRKEKRDGLCHLARLARIKRRVNPLIASVH